MLWLLLIPLGIIIAALAVRIVGVSAVVPLKLGITVEHKHLLERVRMLSREHKDHTSGEWAPPIALVSSLIRRGTGVTANKAARGEKLFEFEKWLYDNAYVLREAACEVKKGLMRLRRLPHHGGMPRICEFVQEIVSNSDGFLSAENVAEYIDEYQKETKLTYHELKGLRVAFLYALLEYAAVISSKCIVINSNIKCAGGKDYYSAAPKYIKLNSFIYGVNAHGDNERIKHATALCLESGFNYADRLEGFNRQLIRYNTVIGNTVNSLRLIDDVLCADLLQRHSSVYKIFEGEAVQVFPKMATASQEYYLSLVSRIAEKKHINELYVARHLTALANAENIHVGELLINRPYYRTEAISNIKMRRGLYILGVNVLALAVNAAIVWAAGVNAPAVIAAVLAQPIYVVLASLLIPRAVGLGGGADNGGEVRMDYSKAIPAKDSATVVISQLINSKQELDGAVDNMLKLASANRSPNIRVALLADFAPNSAARADGDEELLQYCSEVFSQRLDTLRFNIFWRERQYNPADKRYSGWERKRGAIMQFNDYLLGAEGSHGFFVKVLGEVKEPAYVIALDSDSFTMDCRELVETAAHPVNAKTDLITFAARTNPLTAADTAFAHSMMSGKGYDVYSPHCFAINKSVLKQGQFCGKGLYRLKNFQSKLKGVLPLNSILSHDLIEGAHLNTKDSECVQYDTVPPDFAAHHERSLRWLRGDFQLLPYLGRRVRNQANQRVRNPINALSKWRILYNMLFALQPVAAAALVIMSVFFGPYMLIPVGIWAFTDLVMTVFGSTRSLFYCGPNAEIGKNLWFAVVRTVVFVCMLPYIALSYLYAVVVTLGRVMFTRKNLLRWNTFAHSMGGNRGIGFWVAKSALNTVFAAVLALCAYLYGGTAMLVAYAPLWILWLVSGLIVAAACRERKTYSQMREDDTQLIRDIATGTWQYFERQFCDEFNYLPCDNYQEDYEVGWVRRTSPTNIGFMILAAVSACELTLIDCARRDELIAGVITTVERLDKWHGNLYNWYDIDSLKVLEPRYVSAVDSGNLVSALMVAKNAVQNPSLKDRIKVLIFSTDLSAMYDYSKNLFYIGTDTRDFLPVHYDLLASEAHLTGYIAVCNNTVPTAHWAAMSRASVKYEGKLLYSWSGGMFEYLMPSLFLESYSGSLLAQSNRNAVRSHIKYGAVYGRDVWGFSECQYNANDSGGLYQYRACGVNNIALKNTAADMVITPYASFLALEFAPAEAVRNIRRLADYGMVGDWGMYEALDTNDGTRVIKTFMSHHQGMIMCAVTNALCDGAIRKYMSANVAVRAHSILLYEPPIAVAGAKGTPPQILKSPTVRYHEQIQAKASVPYVNLLTNGKYSTLVREDSLGYAYYKDTLLNRIEANGGGGVVLKIGDTMLDVVRSATDIEFSSESVRYAAEHSGLDIEVRKTVMQDANGELIRITLANKSAAVKSVRLGYFVEPVLNNTQGYYAHPTFSNMFVRVEHGDGYISAQRKTQARPLHYALKVMADNAVYEGNRYNWLGRSGSEWSKHEGDRADSFGDVLEPVLAAYRDIALSGGDRIVTDICLVVSADKGYIKNVFARCGNTAAYDNACAASVIFADNYWSRYCPDAGGLKFLRRAAARILSEPVDINSAGTVKARGYMSELENAGIDCASPTVAFCIKSEDELSELNNYLEAFRYIRMFVPRLTVVVAYNEPVMYLRPLHDNILAILDKLNLKGSHNKAVNIVNIAERPGVREALKCLCKYYYEQVFVAADSITSYPKVSKIRLNLAPYKAAPIMRPKYELEQGMGGFTDGGAYYVDISKSRTPAPWSNIIATANFGTLITESGGGYTWRSNSRENKLTAWQNDPVLDPVSEKIYFRDTYSGYVWDYRAAADNGGFVSAEHRLGCSDIRVSYNGITARIRQYLDIDSEAKLYSIKLTNNTAVGRRIEVIVGMEAVLSVNAFERGDKIVITKTEDGLRALNLKTMSEAHLSSGTVNCRYLTSMRDLEHLVASGEWVSNSTCSPAMIVGRECVLGAKADAEMTFALSGGRYRINEEKKAYRKCLDYYSGLSSITVSSPDKSFDIMVNHRLMYQVLCSRFFGRCGYYQAGGAFGFRDQLQDCLALMYHDPSLVRAHIIKCASHQYIEGDVQHWWHPDKKGTRTTMTDDLLFLPWLTAEYVSFTADYTLLDEVTQYLSSPLLKEGEHSRYEDPEVSTEADTIYAHCLKAIELVCIRRSERGLPLIGSGDWNDALDKVGTGGQGESVWMAMFLYYIIDKFLPFVKSAQVRSELKQEMIVLKSLLDRYGWDGEWYRRAYFDSGEVIGSVESYEGRIDLLSQAWAVLSGAGMPDKCAIALKSADNFLVSPEYKIIKLLDPPFAEVDAGYISDYPKGVRENGGQYSHAAYWYILALIKSGEVDKAYDYFEMISPIAHTAERAGVEIYRGEPYAVSADIYSGAGITGRAGWTYYTGAASWMYKVAVEGFLGLKRRGNKLYITPRLPKRWEGCEVGVRIDGGTVNIKIENRLDGVTNIYINGKRYNNSDYIALNESLIGCEITVTV